MDVNACPGATCVSKAPGRSRCMEPADRHCSYSCVDSSMAAIDGLVLLLLLHTLSLFLSVCVFETATFPGERGLACFIGTPVKMSPPTNQHPTSQLFIVWMPFLLPSRQYQSTEGKFNATTDFGSYLTSLFFQRSLQVKLGLSENLPVTQSAVSRC